MSSSLVLNDYRQIIQLDEPAPRNGPRIPGVNPYHLPLIAEAFPETAYPAKDDTVLWRGDLTALAAAAVVTAANVHLAGCTIPNHPCIDAAINQIAGPGILADCRRIMELQGHPEAIGQAKITRGYDLPAQYVIHTVGPTITDTVTDTDRAALADCYRASLDLAKAVGGICTVAFCAISTGVFAFPKEEAARIALATVAQWIEDHPGALSRVIFTAFTAKDFAIYEEALTQWS